MNFEITKKQTNILKGFAILTVMLSHCADMNLLPFNRVYWSILCQIGMALFLFLSGYGCWKSYCKNGFENYFERKIDRVYIPFMLVQAAELILIALIFGITYSVRDYFTIFTIGKAPDSHGLFDGSMWYIPYIFIWYLAFYIAFGFVEKLLNRCRGGAVFITLFAVVCVVFSNIYFEHCSYLGIQFPLGMLFASKIKRFNKKICLIGIIPLILICTVLEIQFAGHEELLVNRVFTNIGSTCGALVLLILVLVFEKFEFNLMQKVGKLSFYIYLVEAPVIYRNVYISNKIITLVVDFFVIFIVAILLAKILLELFNKKVSLCHTPQ